MLKLEDVVDSVNVAELLDDQELQGIGAVAKAGYEEDMDSRSEWEENNDRWMKLAAQVREEKNFPWDGASNVKYPLLTTAAIQFHARAYPALVPNGEIVKASVVGYDPDGLKQASAERVGKHMSYQVMHTMEDWEEEMDKLLLILPIIGCVFKKTYYNSADDRNISEMVLPKHLVVNYWTKNLRDSYRITQILEFSNNKIVERVRAGIYLEVDLGSPQVSDYDHRATTDEIQGTSPTQDASTPFVILEQHTYLDLDEDGYDEPYIITFEENSGQVLRIVANYELEEVEFNDNDEVIKIEPFEHFTKYSFIPNPDGGFYDVGFGILLGPINESVNTIINQLTDAGTLSNMQSGFLGRGIKVRKGDTQFRPGEWKTINATGDDLSKSILPMPVREPSNVLFQLLGSLLDSGQRLASTTDMMVGENPGQNQKATTTMSVLEQGMKVFTAIYKRVYRSMSKEFNKLFILNGKFLDPMEYFQVLDAVSPEGEKIYQIDYDVASVRIIPTADPNVVTVAQKIAKAQGAMELIPLGVNPQIALKRMLEAQEQPNIEELLTPVEPQPDPEIEFKNKELEVKAQLESRALDIKEAELSTKGIELSEKSRLEDRKQNAVEVKQMTDLLQSEGQQSER